VLKGGEFRAPGLNAERQHQESIGGPSAAVNSDACSVPVTRAVQARRRAAERLVTIHGTDAAIECHELRPARRAGARPAILAASETPFDQLVDWKISRPLTEVLPALCALVLG
jgi:hypothetical protein